jgi:uncharacterized delta-60 repeat protein
MFIKNYARISTILIFIFASILAQAAPGDLDASFAGTGKTRLGFGFGNDQGRALWNQPDGKMLFAGYNGNRIELVRYNTDNSLDASFGAGGKVVTPIGADVDNYTYVSGLRTQGDGKIVVTGYTGFANYNFMAVRYNTDGSLDSTFGAGGIVITDVASASDVCNAMIIDSNQKILLAGFSNANNNLLLVRYNPDGSLDTTFDGDGKVISAPTINTGVAVTIQPDGKILVTGGSSDFTVTRYNTNGSLDTTFGTNGQVTTDFAAGSFDSARAITFFDGDINVGGAPDTIIVAGYTYNSGAGFDYQVAVARYNMDGTLYTGFDTDGKVITNIGAGVDIANSVLAVRVGTQTRIFVSGSTSQNGSTGNDFFVIRYNAGGSLNTGFDGDGIAVTPIGAAEDNAYQMRLISGKLVVAGTTFINDYNSDFALARYDPVNGALDTTFDGDGIKTEDIANLQASGKAVAIQTDNKTVVAGYAQTGPNGANAFAVARYNANGTLDTSFGGDGKVTIASAFVNNQANAAAIQADGKIVAAGFAGSVSGQDNSFMVARFNVDGTADSSFGTNGIVVTPVNTNAFATSIAVQTDGKIVVAGQSSNGSGNTSDFTVARYLANGSLDSSFGTGGKVITAVGVGDDTLNALKIQTDGKILVCGYGAISTLDVEIVRYNSNGTLDNTFGSFGKVATDVAGGDDGAFGMTLQSDGKIIITGYASVSSNPDVAVLRYNPNGTLDSTFGSGGKVTTPIGLTVDYGIGVAVDASGKITVGANSFSGSAAEFAAVRYLSNGALDTSFGFGGKTILDVSSGEDTAAALALDSFGRAVIVGNSSNLFGIVRLQGDLASVRTPFDFDGDGKTDLAIFRPAPGEWWINRSSNASTYAFQFGASTDKIVPADYTGDGRTDVAFFRPSTGQWFVLRSEDNSFYSFPFGANGDVPAPADYDADGKADAAVFRPADNTWYINKSSGGTTITQFGQSGDVPVVADYDGDGKADIAIYRPAQGQWWINRSTAGLIAFQFGNSTDKPVQADFTGDGKADVALFRPSTGEWLILRSENQSFYGFPFGVSTDIPAPGDYDADGKADAAIFRPSASTWYVNKSTGGNLIQQFGINGDKPVPNAFVP